MKLYHNVRRSYFAVRNETIRTSVLDTIKYNEDADRHAQSLAELHGASGYHRDANGVVTGLVFKSTVHKNFKPTNKYKFSMPKNDVAKSALSTLEVHKNMEQVLLEQLGPVNYFEFTYTVNGVESKDGLVVYAGEGIPSLGIKQNGDDLYIFIPNRVAAAADLKRDYPNVNIDEVVAPELPARLISLTFEQLRSLNEQPAGTYSYQVTDLEGKKNVLFQEFNHSELFEADSTDADIVKALGTIILRRADEKTLPKFYEAPNDGNEHVVMQIPLWTAIEAASF